MSFTSIGLVVILSLLGQPAVAAVLSPWTKQPYPESLRNNLGFVTYSFDTQLHDRSASLWMKFVDWDLIQKKLETEKLQRIAKEFSTDYIADPAVLEAIKTRDYALYLRLTHDLHLDVRPEVLNPTSPQKSPATPRSARGVILPTASDFKNLRIDPNARNTIVSDSRLLNNRWNHLQPEEKLKVLQLKYISAQQQTKILLDIAIMANLKIKAKGATNFWQLYGKNLPPYFANLHMTPESGGTDTTFAGLEFRLAKPVTDPTEFLNFAYQFNQTSNRLYFVENPEQRTQFADGDLHLHFGLTSSAPKTIDLDALAHAWNHLVVFHEIRLKNANWLTNSKISMASYKADIHQRGFVRMIEWNHLELRTQIFAPQKTIEAWNIILRLPLPEALKYIYSQLAPKLSRDELMEIVIRAPDLYFKLASTDSFVESLGFAIDQAFNHRILNYLQDKMRHGEYVKLYCFPWLTPADKTSLFTLYKNFYQDRLEDMYAEIAGASEDEILNNNSMPDDFIAYLFQQLGRADLPRIDSKKIDYIYSGLIRQFSRSHQKVVSDWLARVPIQSSADQVNFCSWNYQFLMYVGRMTTVDLQRYFSKLTEFKLGMAFLGPPLLALKGKRHADDLLVHLDDQFLTAALNYFFEQVKENPGKYSSNFESFDDHFKHGDSRLSRLYIAATTGKYLDFYNYMISHIEQENLTYFSGFESSPFVERGDSIPSPSSGRRRVVSCSQALSF